MSVNLTFLNRVRIHFSSFWALNAVRLRMLNVGLGVKEPQLGIFGVAICCGRKRVQKS